MNITDFEIIGTQFIDPANFARLVSRFLLNAIVTGSIIYFFYYRKSQRKDYLITFSLISITVFLVVFLLDNVTLQIGFALGLFAVFGIIRYRTIVIPIKEMTFLFVLIGISIINALSNHKVSYAELLLSNLILLLSCWLFDSGLIKNHTSSKIIMYDNIKLIHTGMETELKEDLESRLGIEIIKIEVGTIDFLKDSAMLNVSYKARSSEPNAAENMDKGVWQQMNDI